MEYRFEEFKELAKRNGFDYPIDVYYGSIFLGTLLCHSNGYSIGLVNGPKKKEKVLKTDSNNFKTKEIAAKMLHWTWKKKRNQQNEGMIKKSQLKILIKEVLKLI